MLEFNKKKLCCNLIFHCNGCVLFLYHVTLDTQQETSILVKLTQWIHSNVIVSAGMEHSFDERLQNTKNKR